MVKINQNALLRLADGLGENSQRANAVISLLKKVSSQLCDISNSQKKRSAKAMDDARSVEQAFDLSLQNVQVAIQEIEIFFNDITSAFEEISDLTKLMSDITDATSVINLISSRSKMLALNARIEASRAKEGGESFAVVATEMQELATSSFEATEKIEQVVQSASNQVHKIVEKTGTQLDQGKKRNEKTKEVLNNLVQLFGGSEDSDAKSIKGIIHFIEDEVCAADAFIDISKRTETSIQDLNTQVEEGSRLISDLIGEVKGIKIIEVAPKEALEKINRFQIIDVRRNEEFRDDLGHIKNARLVTLDETYVENISSLPKDKMYLFVCRSGGRSSRGARLAQSLGFQNVYNLEGGMLKWSSEGCPQEGVSKGDCS